MEEGQNPESQGRAGMGAAGAIREAAMAGHAIDRTRIRALRTLVL